MPESKRSKYMHKNEFVPRKKKKNRINNRTERNEICFCNEKGINVECVVSPTLL